MKSKIRKRKYKRMLKSINKLKKEIDIKDDLLAQEKEESIFYHKLWDNAHRDWWEIRNMKFWKRLMFLFGRVL